MPKNLQCQRRGKGSSVWRSKSFRSNRIDYSQIMEIFTNGKTIMGQVVDIIKDQIHTAPLAKILTEDLKEIYVIAIDGLWVGQHIKIGINAEPSVGNITMLKSINPGTQICNVQYGNYRMARTSGTSVTFVEGVGNNGKIILPSKKDKLISINSIVTIGRVAAMGRVIKPLIRAGTNYYKHKARGKKYPNIKGISMNAVNHPHGGKEPRLGHSTTVSRNAPPGAKVGLIAAKRSGKKKRA